MSVVCACGHASAATDYCDSCGARLDGLGTEIIVARTETAPVELCPRCATPRSGGDRFCEADGYDFVLGVVPAGTVRWEAVVAPDRAYYDRIAPDDVAFPSECAARIFTLTGDALIGRRSESRGISPEIDLSAPPEDPAISRCHARLLRVDDEYLLVDEGSANGTSVNDTTDLITPGTPVPLSDGDRIHLGAWTTITVRRSA